MEDPVQLAQLGRLDGRRMARQVSRAGNRDDCKACDRRVVRVSRATPSSASSCFRLKLSMALVTPRLAAAFVKEPVSTMATKDCRRFRFSMGSLIVKSCLTVYFDYGDFSWSEAIL
jgi:hypothetical protein